VYINFALVVGGKKASIDLVVTIYGDSLITTTSLQLQSCWQDALTERDCSVVQWTSWRVFKTQLYYCSLTGTYIYTAKNMPPKFSVVSLNSYHCKKAFVILTIAFVTRVATVD